MLLRRTEKPLSNTLAIWMLLISPLLHACCDNDLRVIGQAWHSSLLSYSFCVTSPPLTRSPSLCLCYLWCQLSVGDDFSDQAPLSVACGVVDHLLSQQLAHRHVLEAVALGNLQALCSFATARAT